MATYFCRNCWNEIDEEQTLCPQCGADQRELNAETFIAKLIRALKHPEPETPSRAADILGKLKAREAIPALWDVVEQSEDMFIVASAIEALGEFGDRDILERIQKVITYKSSAPVRAAVERVMKKCNITSER
jgi:HEAT repeat protein